jgi:hypothetical protein
LNKDELMIEELANEVLEGLNLEIVDGLTVAPVIDAIESNSAFEKDALDSQAAADQAVSVGDYQAAGHHRELAEEFADLSGSNLELHGATSLELQATAGQQQRADDFESRQAEAAQSGDYATARDLADSAAFETRQADQLAGGSDHSAQAESESANMDWADWHQSISNETQLDAANYAADGNLSAAEQSLGRSDSHDLLADHYGDLGTHGGALAETTPMAPIEVHHVDTYTSISSTTTSTSTSTTSTDSSSIADADPTT